jgi:polysaccharide pyruvyl transferase WcaK-like protein
VQWTIPHRARLAVRRLRRWRELDVRGLFPPPPPRPGPRPRVGLVGYFGRGNYGDELFLEVYRQYLGDRVELGPALESPGSPTTTSGRRRLVDGTDAVLIGGGDLIDPASRRSSYFPGTYLRRPVYIAGVGVPIWRGSDAATIERLRRFFQHTSVRFVYARDPESRDWIARHLEPSAPLIEAPDMVCALDLPEAEPRGDAPVLGVIVRHRQEADDLTNIRRLADRAAGLGYRVQAIVLGTGASRDADLEATRSLALPTPVIESSDVDDLTRAIGSCSLVATMKFHGLVVATMYGVPALALIGTNKNRNFLRRIGRSDLECRFNTADLPDRLTPPPAPIDPSVAQRLRGEARRALDELATRIAAG